MGERSSLRTPAGNGSGPGRRSFCRSLSLAHPLAHRAASQDLCHVGESLNSVALCSCFFFFNLSLFNLILLGSLYVLFVLCARSYPSPPLPDKSASPSLLPSKCVSDSSHRAVIPRQLTSSEKRGGPQIGRVPEGHPTGRETVRPLTRGPAELDGPKAAMPPVPTSSGGSGTPRERCQPRGTELGCVLSSPQSASLCPERSGGDSAAPAPAGTCPRSRTGARCPGGTRGEARPPAGSPSPGSL